MRKIIFSLVLGASLHAGEQITQVTPQLLNGWSSTGVELATVAQASELALPAGTQLTRSFSGDGIAVRLVTQPVFSRESTDWPVLEIGSVALVFLRHGDEGKLALALDENAPLVLPLAIALAADGHSTEPITLAFTRHGSVVTVETSGQTLRFAAAPTENSLHEVVVSAGASQIWPLETLVVTVFTPEAILAGANAPAVTASAGGGVTTKRLSQGSFYSSPGPVSITRSDNSTPLVTPGPASASSGGGGTLEIFTPPSVRPRRAAAVRAAAQGQLQD